MALNSTLAAKVTKTLGEILKVLLLDNWYETY